MIKANKGKDLHKVPKSKLIDGPYILSKKYDGHYVQIKYDGQHKVRFWTSGGKEFYIAQMAYDIIRAGTPAFHIECEYNYDCEGKLGDRGKSAILTTYRTNYIKKITTPGHPHKDIFRVLDALDLVDVPFRGRVSYLGRLLGNWNSWFMLPTFIPCPDIATAELTVKRWYAEGYEGGMLKHPDHVYQPGKRTNDIIKLKPRPTADLLCIGWKHGKPDGKYFDVIGSLQLQDSEGRTCWAGSGLDDADRDLKYIEDYVGKVWEIEYDSMADTYVQPILKRSRDDKSVEDID